MRRKVKVWIGAPSKAAWFGEVKINQLEATVLNVLRKLPNISYRGSSDRYHMELLGIGPLRKKEGEVFVFLLRWDKDGKIVEIKNSNPAALVLPPKNCALYIMLEPLFLYC